MRAVCILPLALAASLLLASRPAIAAPWAYRVVDGEVSDASNRWTAGATGAVVEIEGRVTVRLRGGTTLRVERRASQVRLDAAAPLRTFVLDLVAGAVDVEAKPATGGERRAVLVHTARDLTGVTAGGRLSVATTGKRSSIANHQGLTWVGENGGGFHPLAAGTVWSSARGARNPRAITEAPALDSSRRAFAGLSGPATIDGLHWSALASAARYVVRLEAPDGTRIYDEIETTGTNQPRAFAPVPAGAYVARVTALDDSGLSGLPSAPLALNVIGLSLPPSGYVDESGVVRLVPHEAATLTHVGGLIASYGNAQTWGPAPSAIEPFRGETTLVRVRHPKDQRSVDLTVSPGSIAVRVHVGPKTVRWPGEPVEIVVLTPPGLPDRVQVLPRVSVGIDPVPVEFKRDGRALRGVLAPRPDLGPGPWVVRVEVEDQFGHLLGRDFVEVGVEPIRKVSSSLQVATALMPERP